MDVRTRTVRRLAGAPALVLVLALTPALAAATLIAAGCGKKSPSPQATVTVTAPPSGSTTAKPTTKPTTPTKPAVKQDVIAVAAGSAANALAVVTPKGKSMTLVPAKAGAIDQISWSPDAARIAYVQAKSSSSAAGNLWVYNVATGKAAAVMISGASRVVAGYTWVGATQLIASVMTTSTTYHVNGQFYLCDLAKGTSSQVKDSGGNVVRGIWPSSSADSTSVAYVRYGPAKASSQPESLMIYDADTLSLTKVATKSLPTDFDNDAFIYPAISPDGSLIAACQTGSDPGYGITFYRSDGSVAATKGGLVWPGPGSWTASTGKFTFGGDKGSSMSKGSVFVFKPGGSVTAVYTATNKIVGGTSWSPSGGSIAFGLRPVSGDVFDLWTATSTGGSPHLVMKTAAWPAWTVAAVPGL